MISKIVKYYDDSIITLVSSMDVVSELTTFNDSVVTLVRLDVQVPLEYLDLLFDLKILKDSLICI